MLYNHFLNCIFGYKLKKGTNFTKINKAKILSNFETDLICCKMRYIIRTSYTSINDMFSNIRKYMRKWDQFQCKRSIFEKEPKRRNIVYYFHLPTHVCTLTDNWVRSKTVARLFSLTCSNSSVCSSSDCSKSK